MALGSGRGVKIVSFLISSIPASGFFCSLYSVLLR